MHLVYLDDSFDESIHVLSALMVPVPAWNATFARLKAYRRRLYQKYGLKLGAELHATKLIAGKGDISNRPISRRARADIYRDWLRGMAVLEDVRLINAVFPRKRAFTAFCRVLNRVNRTMKHEEDHALLICDEGKDKAYTKLVRKMSVYNPIPSMLGRWTETGGSYKNIPLDHIVEDPVFRDSKRCMFIQSVDLVAFALLRQERPTERYRNLGMEDAFDILDPILFRRATANDPRGILRP